MLLLFEPFSALLSSAFSFEMVACGLSSASVSIKHDVKLGKNEKKC